jgi:RHS repeat-associated protein
VFVWHMTDVNIGTHGFPIEASRHYISTRAIDGPTGYGWNSSLAARLHYTTYLFAAPSTYQKEADIRMPTGAFYRFIDDGTGNFTPPAGRKDTLVRNADGTFELRLQRSMSRYLFAADGSLQRMVDDYGNALQYTYDANGRLLRIADDSGSTRFLDVLWGADGRISGVEDSAGRTWMYTYDTRGVMVSVEDAADRVWTFTYANGKHAPLLTGVLDPWGRAVTNVTYDPQDRVLSYTGHGALYTYNYAAGVTTKTDPLGNIMEYPHASGGLVTDSRIPGTPANEVPHTDYNADGAVILVTDQLGIKTQSTYTADGSPASVTVDWAGPMATRFEYAYDPAFPGRVTSIVAKVPSTGAVNRAYREDRADYYQVGSPAPGAPHRVYSIRWDGTAMPATEYVYDSHGRKVSQTAPGGAVTDFEWNAAGDLLRMVLPPNNAAGTRPDIEYTYDSLGRMTSITGTNGKTLTFDYDALDRVTKVTLPKPFPGAANPIVTMQYDAYNSASGLVLESITDPDGRIHKRGFDQYGRLGSEVDPLGNTRRFQYANGRLTSVVDAHDNVATIGYDGYSRLGSLNPHDRVSGSTWTETYAYHPDGMLKSITDRRGQTITYGYDRLRRIVSKTYPGGTGITATYVGDMLTRLTDTTTAPTTQYDYDYDPQYRLRTEVQGPRGTLEYTWDADARVQSMSLSGGPATTYTRYPDGSVKSMAWSAVAGQFQFTWTLGGRPASITAPNGQVRSYTYDDLDRIIGVESTHPAAGLLSKFDYGYDVDHDTGLRSMFGRMTGITANVPAQGLTNALTKLWYDGAQRLRQVQYPAAAPFTGATEAWTYDAIGNRISYTGGPPNLAYSYTKNVLLPSQSLNPLNGQRLSSDGVYAYTYDADGNTITKSGNGSSWAFTWDTEDRLKGVSGSTQAGYAYDPLGRRYWKSVDGAATTFTYLGSDILRTTNGATTTDFLPGLTLDQPLAMATGGAVSYFNVDALGSVVLVNDAAGAVQNSYVYDVWGVVRAQSATVANPYGYTGREPGEAGLSYYRYRFYEPGSGSFRSVDPLNYMSMRLYVDGQLNNPLVTADYQYVDNRPADHNDPFGLVAGAPAQAMPPTPPPPMPPGGPNQQWTDDVNDWFNDNGWWFRRNPPPREFPKRDPEMWPRDPKQPYRPLPPHDPRPCLSWSHEGHCDLPHYEHDKPHHPHIPGDEEGRLPKVGPPPQQCNQWPPPGNRNRNRNRR